MTLDPVVSAALEARLGAGISQMSPVTGGCVSPSYRVTMTDGRTIFLKTAPTGATPGLLEQESVALDRLAAAGAVRVPGVLAGGPGWLALEWLEPAEAALTDWALLGRQLAALHRTTADSYGWAHDNYIGTLPQPNEAAGSWSEFWAERRLRPQLEHAGRQLGRNTRADFDRLLLELDDRLDGAVADGPSLLHGDLWSGNVHMTRAGPALIDPASYYGHREVDLAMATLFGGFPAPFHEGYAAEWPLLPGAEARRPIYQLYYLLVHLNLFGASYLAGTERALRAALT